MSITRYMLNVVMDGIKDTGMMADYAEHAFKDTEHKSAAGWFATRAKNRLSALERDWHDVHDELKQGHHDDDLIDALACHVDHSIADLKARIDKM